MARKKLLENDAIVKATGYHIKYHPKGAAKTLFESRDEELLMAGPAGTGKVPRYPPETAPSFV